MSMNLTNRVDIITSQFSVVVKGLEKELRSIGYQVEVIEHMSFKNVVDVAFTDVYILYLPDSILDDPKNVESLLLICDKVRDHNRRLILIGSDNSKTLFMKKVPAFQDFRWFSRPIEMNELVLAIEMEIDRVKKVDRQKSILIVDDDPVYAQMVKEWIKDAYMVDTVIDGMQTITYLNSHKVDLILLDYEMPIVDGPKILEMLRSHPETAKIPVMFLTGIDTKASIQRVMALKPKNYILKSTTKDKLISILGEFFDEES